MRSLAQEQLSRLFAMADEIILSVDDNEVGAQLIDEMIMQTLETYLPWSRWATGLYAFARWDTERPHVELGHVINATPHDMAPVA